MKEHPKVIPLAAMEKLLKNCGAARVSDDAKRALKEVIEEFGEKLGTKAVNIAEHAGRKTVKGKDIKIALK